MAISLKDYTKITQNIQRHKKHKNKFLFVLTHNKKKFRKILTIEDKLTTQEYKNEALKEFTKFYKNITQKQPKEIKPKSEYDKILTINDLYMFFYNQKSDLEKKKSWERAKHNYYLRHIKTYFEKLNIPLNDLKNNDIQYFLNVIMSNKINPKTQKNYSNRYIKTAFEILQPIFKFAYDNEIIKDDISSKIEYTRIYKKKIIPNATTKYYKIYNAINKIYKKKHIL